MNNRLFSDNLKYFREQNSLTQQEVANKLKIERSTYCCYERGKTEPNIKNLLKLCKIFNIDCNALLGYCVDPNAEVKDV